MARTLIRDDAYLLLRGGVAKGGADREAVELCFGKRERAFLLDRVLGREDQERAWLGASEPLDRHLRLGHRLEQRRLRLRHRAVDLIDEEDVREDRARPEVERAGEGVVDGKARDVGRLKIR